MKITNASEVLLDMQDIINNTEWPREYRILQIVMLLKEYYDIVPLVEEQ